MTASESDSQTSSPPRGIATSRFGRAAVRLQVALQHLRRRTADRLRGGHAGDLRGRAVPEHDAAVAVDGDDAVGDVGEDRDALLALDRDALVELGVRERRPTRWPRAPRAPAPPRRATARLARVDGEHAVRAPPRARQRHAEVGAVAVRQDRVRLGADGSCPTSLVRDGRARLDHVTGQPGRRR